MFLIFFLAYLNTVNGNPEIDLPLGKLQGHILKTYNKKEFIAFEGIPYAKPPIKSLRFEDPQPNEPWLGVLVANKIRVCMQYNHYTTPGNDFVIGDEDCLHLNVYIPNIDTKTLKNVIVYIHGGAFMFGSGGAYGPSMLLDQNIVFITLNYRLGPLGFLSTEDKVLPGNIGLKDQVLALEWIKDNVKYFGGNPDSITLSGMSAGGGSVQFHALSPLSKTIKGLFHRGISQSGCVLNPWVLAERSLEKSKQLATHLNCPTSNTKNMISCLKDKPAYDIVNAVKLFQVFLYNPISPFGVVIDKWSSKPFLNDHPYMLLKKGKVLDVPWIFSHVESEGLYPGSEFWSNPDYLQQINDRWDELIPHILEFNNTVNTLNRLEVLRKIRHFYFGNKLVSKETFPNLINMMSDRLFANNIEDSVKLHSVAVSSPVYHYYFSYRGAHSKSETLSQSNNNFGASHGDDTIYILSSNINTTTTPADKEMSKVLINLWLSFSTSVPKVGDINWLPVSKDKHAKTINSLKIESPYKYKMAEIAFGNSEFWNSLPFQENHNLYPERDEL